MAKPTLTPGWALYLRVSTEDAQTPERSFSMQQTEIRERLLAGSDLPVIQTYRDIMTGTAFDRTGFNTMLFDARAGRFSHLAIYRVDRFGRDTAEGLGAGKALRRLGVRVIPASNPSLDITTPDGWMMWTILLGLGEHEVDVLRKRSSDGMRDKIMQGHFCWPAPDGFVHRRRVINTKKMESWMEIDPDRAPIIREAWDLLLTGEYSYEQICNRLHEQGYTRNSGRPWVWYAKGKKRYARATLSRIFHNPLYAGWIVSEGFGIVWGEVRSQAGAIVTDAEYAQAQRILEVNNTRRHKTKHRYLLSGLAKLVIGDEEIPLQCTTITTKEISYYYVDKKHMGEHRDQGLYLNTDQVEAQLPTLLAQLVVDRSAIPELQAAYREQVRDAVEDSLAVRTTALKRQIADLLEQEKHYARLHAQGRLSGDAFDALAVEARADLARAQVQLSRIERGAGDRIRDLDQAVRLMRYLGDAWPHWNYRDRREVLRLVFRHVRIDPQAQLLPSPLRTPFAYLHQTVTRVTQKPDGAVASSGSCGSGTVLLGTPTRT